jgi:hypothetical protein
MKYLNLDNITTGVLAIGIILAIWVLTIVIKKYNEEKDKGTTKPAEYYRRRFNTTLSELASLQAAEGNLATNQYGETQYKPDEGVFSRDPAAKYVRKGVLGSSGFEIGGDSESLNPLAFSAGYGKGKDYGDL